MNENMSKKEMRDSKENNGYIQDRAKELEFKNEIIKVCQLHSAFFEFLASCLIV